ncbi:hypothetical protein DNHGIG_39840 [Collibacillus ludicampi]|uniref:Uncharacterized protein n=1 Tax=Collibacillus ludicampi TaxID=2771369 RepID=A0AAV4LL05_9BACL|nr:hypothetical protein [Collibacillus ludicampi]GIM48435.1 hypothetical protein DNHGIG_39840 [Collibacillus ludicampi]
MIMRQIVKLLQTIERETERGTPERQKAFEELNKLALKLAQIKECGDREGFASTDSTIDHRHD